ncbi:hypothetical protein AYI69_g5412 [Smittium culicis]|uniref:Uncharacterized protein n=1 Tax=Smittium culicis TaxID=133412 RepID=A0A1R1Y696_9FUNG|nr:hypothetical protein AYI69_g5412 [Smittium culicis]
MDHNKRPKIREPPQTRNNPDSEFRNANPKKYNDWNPHFHTSISKSLSGKKADLSLSQLLQVSKSIRNEFMILCRRVSTKDIKNVE